MIILSSLGEQARSPTLELDTKFHDDFETGKEDEFELSCVPVGDLICLDMKLSSVLASRKWYLEEVIVIDEGAAASRFPCYQWLTHNQPTVTLRPANRTYDNINIL